MSLVTESIASPGFTVSIELFPPKGEKAAERALREAEEIHAGMEVAFTSVTYGAGGTTREGTLELVLDLARRHPGRVVAHLTCIGANEGEMGSLLATYLKHGMRDILALRGDLPDGMAPEQAAAGGFRHAIDLVQYLRKLGGFASVGVACFPEGHPETPDLARHLAHFAAKAEAGGDYAVSQFFFENHLWERFMEECARRRIAIPLAPGIMPVRDLEQLLRFAVRCGATVPKFVVDALAPYKDDPEGFKDRSADLAAAQIEGLQRLGVRHAHLYSLNKSDIVIKMADRLGWRKAAR
ncbi:MAG: methylenetetrahydrofolate reductase [Candidatus Tectomicrobia bacterium]|uniref:Methylenetetrahydrofolate reductase n=1 Tax=Tectimicrobiota bacterium TaxID=2528274 RepID=A0A932ML35_UNCTE|nr:methylenetetrahydrofolate reductase [Candidatus Tectomicrobia bacterium]